MGQTHINVLGTWKKVLKIWARVAGVWKLVSPDAYTFTFTANASNVNMLTAIGATNIANYAKINVVIPSGITISGVAGVAGVAGAVGSATVRANCHTSKAGNGGNGTNATNGSPCMDFSGITGKQIKIINNGVVQCPNGANGGNGGAPVYISCTTTYGGCGGTAGVAGKAVYNPNGNSITWVGNEAVKGTDGVAGAHGSPASLVEPCNCNCCCFLRDSLVTMYDGTEKKIVDVKVGDFVLGAFDEPNQVIYLQRPNAKGVPLFSINGMVTTKEHGVVNGERTGFNYVSINTAEDNKNSWHESVDKFGNEVQIKFDGLDGSKIKLEEFNGTSTVFTKNGSIKAVVEPFDFEADTLYHLVLIGGSKTFAVDGVFVSGWCDTESFKLFRGL
jgi:hypothetical protein